MADENRETRRKETPTYISAKTIRKPSNQFITP